MQNNGSNSSEETISYSIGTSTEGSSGKQEPEVIGEVEVSEKYDFAKPKRKVIRAKIFPK